MDQQLIEKVMKQVSDELGIGKEECKAEPWRRAEISRSSAG